MSRSTCTWCAAVAALAISVPALAQFTGSGSSSKGTINVTPPKPAQADSPPMFMTYVSVLAIAAAVIGANLMPSKRGHQD